MGLEKSYRISKILQEFNIGLRTLTDFLDKKGIDIGTNPNAKISGETYAIVEKEFKREQLVKEESKKVAITVKEITGQKTEPAEEPEPEKEIFIKTNVEPLHGPKIVGTIDLDNLSNKEKSDISEKKDIVEKKIEVKIPSAESEKPAKSGKPAESEIPEREISEKPVQAPVKIAAAEQEQKKTAAEPEKIEEKKPEQVKENPAVKSEFLKKENPAAKKPETAQKLEKKENMKEERRKPFAKKTDFSNPANNRKKTFAKPSGESTPQKTEPKVIEHIETTYQKLEGPVIKGTMDLSQFEKKKDNKNRGKRDRIRKKEKVKVNIEEVGSKFKNFSSGRNNGTKNNNGSNNNNNNNNHSSFSNNNNGKAGKRKRDRFKPIKNEVDEDAVQRQIKETYQKMVDGKNKSKSSRYKKEKREASTERIREEKAIEARNKKTLKLTEFVTVNDLSVMMTIPVTKVIGACMSLGLMVSINQRLDAETLVLVAEEFGYKVEFVTADIQETIDEENEKDKPEDLRSRPAIVTVMGHVDHGKTSLLDYVRKSNVIAGEAGGITQHIGAYNVKLSNGRRITFLDTPGHEAFTAMRARGAQITDLVIIIVAADDAIMPQTVEAINHAQAAGVPMIFAINKIDKPGANPEKIKEQLSNMNILVEDWGGKYQCQEISAKKGIGVEDLLEKVLLEADMLDLKANPDKRAIGTVIESSLDKGRGYLATILVQGGTLHTGDIMLSGCYYGRVKAMFNERGQKIEEAGPSTPVSVLGLNGAPTAGDKFNVFENEKEAKSIAGKREQLIRIQGIKTQKHITLEEIGRRIAIGNFQELNIVVKGDVDGSVEALSDSLIKLSSEEIHVNVIHKAVGEISESDVLLAAASNAIIIGFQVRPSGQAKRIAENEQVQIRMYSVIYDAINEVKSGIEGMLAPVEKEEVTATCEVRETFKISKVGTIAGCMVKDGKIGRGSKVRVIRDGIVIHSGVLSSLKRFKDDVKEVAAGFDCGLSLSSYNDLRTGDIIESYTITEVKRTL
ncbi:MAG: translation initiation factor IF-2 [Bacteroidales bacterium]|jgi:translation initiation factor IF-2|nr:translation initiation factor IF-2 [Bacteroidales bacterium]